MPHGYTDQEWKKLGVKKAEEITVDLVREKLEKKVAEKRIVEVEEKKVKEEAKEKTQKVVKKGRPKSKK